MVISLVSFVVGAALRTGNFLVVPGSSVGRVQIGQTIERVTSSLGEATDGDAASGHVWSFWIGKSGHQLGVYAVRTENDMVPHVRLIRVTSPSFHLTDGFRVGAPVTGLKGFKPAASYVSKGVGEVTLLDNAKAGIALEAKGRKCVAIIVYSKQFGLLPNDLATLDEQHSGQ